MRSPTMSSASSRRAARSGWTSSAAATESIAGSVGGLPAFRPQRAASAAAAPPLAGASRLRRVPLRGRRLRRRRREARHQRPQRSPHRRQARALLGGREPLDFASGSCRARGSPRGRTAAAALRRISGENSVSVFMAGLLHQSPTRARAEIAVEFWLWRRRDALKSAAPIGRGLPAKRKNAAASRGTPC